MPSSTANPVFDAALALPAESRAELADLLQQSLSRHSGPTTQARTAGSGDEIDRNAEQLSAHFHEAKKIALNS
jgi:hypothetical protein